MKTTTRHASKVYPSGDFACRAANTLKRHAPKMVSCVFTLAFMAFMLAKPEYYLDSARKGLALFATSVLPSLFPFYFCSLLLTYSGAVGAISKLGEKPVKLMEILIGNSTKEGEVVMDFAMGIGSTGVACKNLNRGFIGMEIDPDYFRIAEQRIYYEDYKF